MNRPHLFICIKKKITNQPKTEVLNVLANVKLHKSMYAASSHIGELSRPFFSILSYMLLRLMMPLDEMSRGNP